MSTKTLGYVSCWKTGQRAYYRTVKTKDVESIAVLGNVVASSGDKARSIAKRLFAQPPPVGHCRALLLADRLVTETAEFEPLTVSGFYDTQTSWMPCSSVPNIIHCEPGGRRCVVVDRSFCAAGVRGHTSQRPRS